MYDFDKKFYADVRIEDRYETTIVYKNKLLESYKVRNAKRAFIRVFDGKMWYYASTSEIGNVQKELCALYSQATPNEKINENPIVKQYEVNVCEKYCFEDNSVRNITKQQKTDLLESYFDNLKSEYLMFCQSIYLDRNSNYQFYSSLGSDIKYDYQLCGLAHLFALAKDKEQFMNSFQLADSSFDKLSGQQNKLDEQINKSENYVLNAVPCVKGDFPVVLSPMVAGVFAHESFGHKSEADFMLGDETLAKEWEIGKKVGSDILSIGDKGTDLGSGYVPFDDEGTKAKGVMLITNGVLSGRLHSATTAAYLNEKVTGNARAINCKYEPIVRMTNTFIQAGKNTFEELIQSIDNGYYIENLSHGSGMSQFTIAPTLAYEIKNGKIGRPVKISVITGSVFETLGLIDGLSNKVESFSFVTGGCGKMEQFPLNVAFGGPYVRISKMNVQ